MNYKLSVMLIPFFCLNMLAAESFELKTAREYSPNLLRNPGFEELDGIQ